MEKTAKKKVSKKTTSAKKKSSKSKAKQSKKTGSVRKPSGRAAKRKGNGEHPSVFGAPPKYDPKYCQDLLNHFSSGFNYSSFPGTLYEKYKILVCRATLYNWESKHQEFLDTKNIGRDLQEKFWLKMGLSGSAGKLPGFKPASWIFITKNMFNYKDKVEHSGEIASPQKSMGEQLKDMLCDPAKAAILREAAERMAASDDDTSAA